MALREWLTRVDSFAKATAGKLPTPTAIRDLLASLVERPSEIHGLRIKIVQGAVGFESGKLGLCDGPPSSTINELLSGPSGITAKIAVEAWTDKKKHELVSSDFSSLLTALNDFWMPDQRHERFGNLNLKSPEVQRRLPTIDLPGGRGLFVVYLDLVGFKKINEEIGEAAGDDLIARMGGCAVALSIKYPTIFTNDGGDEFVALVPDNGLHSLLSFLWDLRETAPRKTPKKTAEQVRFTAGVARLDGQVNFESIASARAAASNVAKSQKDPKDPAKKRRDCVTIQWAAPRQLDVVGQTAMARMLCALIKARQYSRTPFSNAALNIISDRCRDSWTLSHSTAQLNSAVRQSIEWLNLLELDGADEIEFLGDAHWNTQVSSLAICAAIAHGILSAITRGKRKPALYIRTEKTGKNRSALYAGGAKIWGAATSKSTESIAVGPPIEVKGALNVGQNCSPVIKLSIGVSKELRVGAKAEVPSDLFVDSIVVDDRPHIGGGLPDFWQAAFAQLVQALNNAPHASRLLVWGDKRYAPEVISRLGKKGVSTADRDVLASVTGLPIDAIRRSLRRLAAPRFVVYCDDVPTAISTLHAAYQQFTKIKHPATSTPEVVPSLQVDLRDKDYRLHKEDGVRCATAAEAYPIVLNTFRSSEDIDTTFDDAAQKLQELMGFKIVLSAPEKDPIPVFWTEQTGSMNQYWQKVLLPPNGMVSQHFCKDGQYKKVVKFLSGYCGDNASNHSTRRAIVIVPNQYQDEDPKPLGLISVWATPRVATDGTVQVHFSFVWRTVEAFVGLPYSLYGSIRLAQSIVSDLRAQRKASAKTDRIEVGSLTYLALSLHMRDDHFHRRIAKKIVTTASK